MTGERDLRKLISGMEPVLDPMAYSFVSVAPGEAPTSQPLMRFRETEGDTLILSLSDAEAQGLDVARPFRRITLTVHSDLEAVGLTAAFSNALAEVGISANVVAGFYHDHIFVPEADADAALAALMRLSGEEE